MQCHIDTIVPQSGQNILMSTLKRMRARDCPLAIFDSEDFKGLREWVMAKRRSEINPVYKYQQIYSAPWRIG
jgi:hypothetical protein